MLEIRLHPDPVLRQVARPVRKINASVRRLLDEMAETMRANSGVGLAAPQVGIGKRVIVVDVGEGLIELVNPEITAREGEQVGWEGCLSIPGKIGKVRRDQKVTVTGFDRHGRQRWVTGEGFLARALQHEIDHLDGRLYIDLATEVTDAPAAGDEGEPDDATAPATEAGPAEPARSD